MRRLFFIVIVLAAVACSKTPSYKITANLEGAEGTLILEQRDEDGGWITKDSAVVDNGAAVLEGTVEVPELYYLSIKGTRSKMILFVENSEITVTGKVDSLANAVVSGSAVQDEYDAIKTKISKITDEYMDLYRQAREAGTTGDTAKANALMAQVEELYGSVGTLQEDFIKDNPASFVTPYFLASIQYDKNEEQLDSLLNDLDPALSSTMFVKSLKARVDKMKTVAVGQKAPDFTQNDPDGNPVTFSDVYSANEYTFVDFWASWCGPCRQENPNVVAVYTDYHDKGFSVFGVSLDRTKEDWLKGIEDDGLTWQHVSDLSYWSNAAAKLYAINSIPANLLVDKNGIIIAKGLRGEDLRAKISELLD